MKANKWFIHLDLFASLLVVMNPSAYEYSSLYHIRSTHPVEHHWAFQKRSIISNETND
ncbi:hypothetical protein [Bacillus stercoris]|uniref:hypothetical protein n=1 Tax=Bacillus stercoris TaxID=2054641 RepID=UPI0024450C1E|nr:hypothetical protein [Bacillus stercoris]WGE38558.1 hypothetical protein QA442_19535 [Bacillus stercoris]